MQNCHCRNYLGQAARRPAGRRPTLGLPPLPNPLPDLIRRRRGIGLQGQNTYGPLRTRGLPTAGHVGPQIQ
eukprot:3748632-Lingulodinium_polyedra.AAC.1